MRLPKRLDRFTLGLITILIVVILGGVIFILSKVVNKPETLNITPIPSPQGSSPTPSPTISPTPKPTKTPTLKPKATILHTPTSTPTTQPTVTPSPAPTNTSSSKVVNLSMDPTSSETNVAQTV